MMHSTQVQLTQMVSSAVSQALTQHMQQTASDPPLATAASIAAAVQQVHPLTKSGRPAFEGDNAESWLP